MNYEQDIRIDATALDVEWLDQPSLMFKYGRYAAEMRVEFDKAKEALDLTRAEIDKEIRMNPAEYDIEKITEGVVQATIITQEDYKKANKVLSDAKFELDIAQAAVRAMDARKDALENLVRLNGQQYFAGPKMPRDLAWEREEKEKKLNTSIVNKITRPRRVV